MSKSVRVIHFDEQAVGRRIKSTKKRYTWKFALDNQIYSIDLFVSKFSGKNVIKVNDEKLFEGKKEGKIFHRSLDINNHNIIIIEVGKGFDLRIDGISFNIYRNQNEYHQGFNDSIMSNVLIPDSQEDWEKAARPYEIIVREGLNVSNREKLDIQARARGRNSVVLNNVVRRFTASPDKHFLDY